MNQPKQIVILGGGFSGALTAIHLALGSQPCQMRITVVNPTPDIGRGLAYRFDDDNLLLNVPAGNMSALADDPSHFVSYCQRIDPSLSSGSFVSRRLYGQYLQDLWNQTVSAHPGAIRSRVDRAVLLKRSIQGSQWDILMESGLRLRANQVVIATGHQLSTPSLPLEPEVKSRMIDPWDYSAMHRLPRDQSVVIMGTGHTAIDTLFCLARLPRKGTIYLISRHGLLPHRHRLTPTAPLPNAFPAFLRGLPPTVRAYTRALRQHLRVAAERDFDWRNVFNELRPYTPQIWQTWPDHEKSRFLRHLQAHWDVHRHRLAPMAAQRLDQLMREGRTQVVAARITSVCRRSEGVDVAYRARGTLNEEHIHASAVINCIGPNNNLRRSTNTLLSQLQADGLITPDAHGLGLMVTPDLQILDSNLKLVRGLSYVGPLLKGVMWEATAVPELRLHAYRLACYLLSLHDSHCD